MISHPNLIAGMEHGEDAGVYLLREDLAIIQTVDFFTPIVDDPYTFGQIAATNALGDVYAMGGRPLTAMNIVCFPVGEMDISVLRDILRGGLDKMKEAEVLLVGGHSVEDNELKYGLAVTGVVHPDRVLRNRGALAGDVLILTKPIGTGIISTAIKGGLADPDLVALAIAAMTTLNKEVSVLMEDAVVHACTDVTGFGLLGHAAEMIEDTDVGLEIYSAAVPVFPGLEDLVESGIMPAGLYRNRKFRKRQIDIGAECPEWLVDIFFDPQTAGGLLIALPEDDAVKLLGKMHAGSIPEASMVGRVLDQPEGRIRIV